MKNIIPIPFILIATAISAVSADPSHACSPPYAESRFFQYQAPAGGVFFVHLTSIPTDSGAELEEQLTLLDGQENEYDIEIVGQTDAALAIRVPEAEVGTTFTLLGSELSESWSTDDESLEIIEDETNSEEVELPEEVDVDIVTTEESSVAIPLSPLDLMYSCGGYDGPGLRSYDEVAHAEFHFPRESFDQGPLILDLWRTDVGEELDTSERPIYAGVGLGTAAQLPDSGLIQETGETIFFVLTTGMLGENADVHLRLRDPRTGLPGEVITKTIHLPERQENVSYGCQALPQVPMSFMGLFSLLLGMGLYRRRD
jgi:hypothetical protein